MLLTLCWAALVALAILCVADMEKKAIDRGIGGANGLIFLLVGGMAALSLPIGFVLLWLFYDFQTAALHSLAVAIGGAWLWFGLLRSLDKAGKSR
jgi:hypothetical protein